jgi:hypothetical protein
LVISLPANIFQPMFGYYGVQPFVPSLEQPEHVLASVRAKCFL